MLQTGDSAPDFSLTAVPAATVSKAALLGKRYLLYFYPADDTPGCTKEACAFRDQLPKFGALAIPVFGVSPDDAVSHEKFRAKYTLNFPLLSDPGHELAGAFGAWGEKNLYGRVFMGILRSSFLIGPDGRIERAWPRVNPEIHAAEVLAHLAGSPAPAKKAGPQKKSAPPAAKRRRPAPKPARKKAAKKRKR